jgi:hypothetical protein
MPEHNEIKNVRRLLAIAALGLACACATARRDTATAPINPLDRQTAMEWIRLQILQKTWATPEARYNGSLRPSLERQLRAQGFDEAEIAVILDDVARSRFTRSSGCAVPSVLVASSSCPAPP